MAKYRQAKLDEEISRAISSILGKVRDSRLEGCVFSVTGVHVAPDLSTAEVYYSYIGKKSPDEVKKGLKSANGFIRSSLARTLSLRQTPELTFTFDTSMENGARIFELLKTIDIPAETSVEEQTVSDGETSENKEEKKDDGNDD